MSLVAIRHRPVGKGARLDRLVRQNRDVPVARVLADTVHGEADALLRPFEHLEEAPVGGQQQPGDAVQAVLRPREAKDVRSNVFGRWVSSNAFVDDLPHHVSIGDVVPRNDNLDHNGAATA